MKKLALCAAVMLAMTVAASAQDTSQKDNPDPKNWDKVLADAKGQTVYFNAWGGSENVNNYIEWTATQIEKKYGVKIIGVKVDDTANAVAKVVAEKAAGKDKDGTVDMIWINGENFVAMKKQHLIMSPGWAQDLPNWKYVDVENKPTVTTDFTMPVEGYESPWGMAKLVFFYDSARTKKADLPKDADGLLAWAKANPGRFSYPQPPDFIGSSFLKQILIEKAKDPSVLQEPVEEASFDTVTKPLFDYLDKLNPVMWRQGKAYPQNYPDMKRLLADNELDIIFAFNPSEASSSIDKGELPDTVRSFTFPGGTLANTHFVTIPYNASAKAGALVVANFLISPEAQAHKQNPDYWGDPTVLAMSKLDKAERRKFEDIDLGVATLKPDQLGPALDEPHATWMNRIEDEWKRRYGVGN